MRIGVITYYKVMNFGATLQAVSTYTYLKSHGYNPIFINYQSRDAQKVIEKGKNDPQWKAQLDFVNSIITEQTDLCETTEDVLKQIELHDIDAIIVGSDALLQHHPFVARWRMGKYRPNRIYIAPERIFPNMFWGVGLSDKVPMSLMSVSSQNSPYNYFLPSTKYRMKKWLSQMKYISVRDTWTKDMLFNILKKEVKITPDPVFAFNQNAHDLIPSKNDVLMKYGLPEKYVLLSLFGQVISKETITQIRQRFEKDGSTLVILPMPTGSHYEHDAKIQLDFPMPPIDWYALIKYSSGYVGSNMHPIVVCLHNAVPCFSLDNWGRVDFRGKKIKDDSSKILHIMKQFGVECNHRMIDSGHCDVTAEEIYDGIHSFPSESILNKSLEMQQSYNAMMQELINNFK